MKNLSENDYGFGLSKEELTDYNDKSPISSFWDGRVQALIGGIYYLIALGFILFGDALFGYLIGGCALACNLIWFSFKGWKLFWNWLTNLVVA